jgi:hypothetical protein
MGEDPHERGFSAANGPFPQEDAPFLLAHRRLFGWVEERVRHYERPPPLGVKFRSTQFGLEKWFAPSWVRANWQRHPHLKQIHETSDEVFCSRNQAQRTKSLRTFGDPSLGHRRYIPVTDR